MDKKVFYENHCDIFQRTALHFAAAFSSPETTETLLEYQQEMAGVCQLVPYDSKGQIPLHYAAAVGNLKNTKLLLEYIDYSIYYPKLNRKLSENDENIVYRVDQEIIKSLSMSYYCR